MAKRRVSIEELENILNNEEVTPVEILPTGEVVDTNKATSADRGSRTPLTYRENLGGEYARWRS